MLFSFFFCLISGLGSLLDIGCMVSCIIKRVFYSRKTII